MRKLEELTIGELKIYVYDASKHVRQLQYEIELCEKRIVELTQTPKLKETKET